MSIYADDESRRCTSRPSYLYLLLFNFIVLKYEKEQIMKTNVWIDLKWTDFQLMWNPSDYNVNSVRVPFDKIWVSTQLDHHVECLQCLHLF